MKTLENRLSNYFKDSPKNGEHNRKIFLKKIKDNIDGKTIKEFLGSNAELYFTHKE